MAKKLIKKVIKETKRKKDQLLIEQNLVKSRMMVIVESEDNIKNFKKLPIEKQRKMAFQILEEINYLSENKILNEQLGDFLQKIFGNALGGMVETLVEPLIDSILGGLGLGGYFKKFIVSFLTSNPAELAKALKDCRSMTTLIANSLSEALFMMIQEQKGLSGGFATFLRNTLGGAVKDTGFVNKIEDFLGDMVCQGFSKLTSNAEGILDKLKGSGLAPALAGK